MKYCKDRPMQTIKHASAAELMRELEGMAERLAERKCPYMAATLMQYYDGEFASETKEARMKFAKTYDEMARQQAALREKAT